ncbi:LOW QUALITY PROTEIN: Homeobox protein NANOG, partial [Galemys pyrenaicus]
MKVPQEKHELSINLNFSYKQVAEKQLAKEQHQCDLEALSTSGICLYSSHQGCLGNTPENLPTETTRSAITELGASRPRATNSGATANNWTWGHQFYNCGEESLEPLMQSQPNCHAGDLETSGEKHNIIQQTAKCCSTQQ